MAKNELSISLNEKDYERMMSALSGMSELEKDAIINKGLQEGTRLFVKQGKSNLKNTLSKDPKNVKMRTGNLMKSISNNVKAKTGKAYAGFNRPKGSHAHLVDSGTVKRWTVKGAYRGSMKGSNFWRKAFEQQKDNAAKELMESINLSISKIIARNR